MKKDETSVCDSVFSRAARSKKREHAGKAIRIAGASNQFSWTMVSVNRIPRRDATIQFYLTSIATNTQTGPMLDHCCVLRTKEMVWGIGISLFEPALKLSSCKHDAPRALILHNSNLICPVWGQKKIANPLVFDYKDRPSELTCSHKI